MEGGEYNPQIALEQENARKQQALDITRELFLNEAAKEKILQGLNQAVRNPSVELAGVDAFLKNENPTYEDIKNDRGAVFQLWSMVDSELRAGSEVPFGKDQSNEVDEAARLEWIDRLPQMVIDTYSSSV